MKWQLTFLVLILGGCGDDSNLAPEDFEDFDSDSTEIILDGTDELSEDTDSDTTIFEEDTESEQSTEVDDTETATGDSTDEVLTICEPGETQVCVCSTGTNGAQSCREDGSGWNPCECIEDADSDTDTDTDDADTDTESVIEDLCDYITCPELPTTVDGGMKYRSMCVGSDFPGVVPDKLVHYSVGSGECDEVPGGYECNYQEHIVSCQLDQTCGQVFANNDPGYTHGECADIE